MNEDLETIQNCELIFDIFRDVKHPHNSLSIFKKLFNNLISGGFYLFCRPNQDLKRHISDFAQEYYKGEVSLFGGDIFFNQNFISKIESIMFLKNFILIKKN